MIDMNGLMLKVPGSIGTSRNSLILRLFPCSWPFDVKTEYCVAWWCYHVKAYYLPFWYFRFTQSFCHHEPPTEVVHYHPDDHSSISKPSDIIGGFFILSLIIDYPHLMFWIGSRHSNMVILRYLWYMAGSTSSSDSPYYPYQLRREIWDLGLTPSIVFRSCPGLGVIMWGAGYPLYMDWDSIVHQSPSFRGLGSSSDQDFY